MQIALANAHKFAKYYIYYYYIQHSTTFWGGHEGQLLSKDFSLNDLPEQFRQKSVEVIFCINGKNKQKPCHLMALCIKEQGLHSAILIACVTTKPINTPGRKPAVKAIRSIFSSYLCAFLFCRMR